MEENKVVGEMRSLSEEWSSTLRMVGNEEETETTKKGAWTEEEDSILVNYVTFHGEGNWNSVARGSGLKRTGKSCRLRWLNYLRPNVRRGNITLQEQLLILDLHFRWGNRWSKIAQELPGRTDNEIKNYWRTRVVKQAKQLKCDVNSKQFRDALRFEWMPRLLERIQAQAQAQAQAHYSPSYSAPPLLLDHDVVVHPQPPSLSDSCTTVSYNGDSTFTHIPQVQSLGTQQAFDPTTALPVQDLWTHENICFLQQQLLSDDL